MPNFYLVCRTIREKTTFCCISFLEVIVITEAIDSFVLFVEKEIRLN